MRIASFFDTYKVHYPISSVEQKWNAGLNYIGDAFFIANIGGCLRIAYGLAKCTLSTIQVLRNLILKQDTFIAKTRLQDSAKQISLGVVESIPILGQFIATAINGSIKNTLIHRSIEQVREGRIDEALAIIEEIPRRFDLYGNDKVSRWDASRRVANIVNQEDPEQGVAFAEKSPYRHMYQWEPDYLKLSTYLIEKNNFKEALAAIEKEQPSPLKEERIRYLKLKLGQADQQP